MSKKILFCYYPLKVHYNHGIRLLTSILRGKGIEVFVLELGQITDIRNVIEEIKPDFVGFSMVSSGEYNFCLPFMREAKKTGIPVLVGGVYVRRGAFIDPNAVDYVCRGEGETLADFILTGNNDLFDNPMVHENLDSFPMPDYSYLTGYEFDRDVPFLKGLRIIPYHSSRGCPFNCSFCEVKFQPKRIRIKTTAREDMDYLNGVFNPHLFHIMDELLPYYDSGWCKRFDGNKYGFIAYIRPDISRDKLLFLIENGLRVPVMGIESGDEKYRNEVLNKELKDDDIYRTVNILNQNGLPYVLFYMMNGPHETEEIKGKTLGMARGLGGYPVIWEYEDLEKRVFKIDSMKLDRMAKRIESTPEKILDDFNDSRINVVSNEKGFIAYNLTPKGMILREIYGDGSYWSRELISICKKFNMKNYYGIMTKPSDAFNRKYGLKDFGRLIVKEI